MSKLQMLRAQVDQRLTAAVDEILGLCERAFVENEEEFSRSQQENFRLRKMLRDAFNPEVRLHRADIQQLLVQQEWSASVHQEQPEHQGLEEVDITRFTLSLVAVKDEGDEAKVQSSQLHQIQTDESTDAEPPSSSSTKTEADGEDCGAPEAARKLDPDIQHLLLQHVWSLSVEQEEPEPPHTKEAQERLWTSQEAEQLHGLKEADINKLPSTLVPVRSENDAKVQSSQLHQSPTEENTEAEPPSSRSTEQTTTEADAACGGPDAARSLDPVCHLQPNSDEETEHSEDDWKEMNEPQSAFNPQKNNDGSVSDVRCNTGVKSFSCSECGATFKYNKNLLRHTRNHSTAKPFSCPVCGKGFNQTETLNRHMRIHTGEKPFSCSVCSKTFTQSGHLKVHMRSHTCEKPFSCSVCDWKFSQYETLSRHMRIHTGEKPFCCSVCGKTFRQNGNLNRHSRIHTGGKPFRCSICGKNFTLNGPLKKHLKIHSGNKTFGCSKCGKRFRRKQNLKSHKSIHSKKGTLRRCV